MIVGFSSKAWEDYLYCQQNDKKILKRINLIIKDIKRNPLRQKRHRQTRKTKSQPFILLLKKNHM